MENTFSRLWLNNLLKVKMIKFFWLYICFYSPYQIWFWFDRLKFWKKDVFKICSVCEVKLQKVKRSFILWYLVSCFVKFLFYIQIQNKRKYIFVSIILVFTFITMFMYLKLLKILIEDRIICALNVPKLFWINLDPIYANILFSS